MKILGWDGIVPMSLLAVSLLIASPLAAQSGDLKIAVIDVQKILTDSVRGKEILAKLEGIRDEKSTQLEGKAKELEDMRKRYEETRLTLAEDKISEMEKQIEDLTIALRRAQDDAQRELQKRQQEDFGQIEQAVMPIINSVGREFGYTLIFNKFQSGLVFADEAIDITDLVIERFNTATAGASSGS